MLHRKAANPDTARPDTFSQYTALQLKERYVKIAVIDSDKRLHNAMTQFFLQFQIAYDCDLSVEHLYS